MTITGKMIKQMLDDNNRRLNVLTPLLFLPFMLYLPSLLFAGDPIDIIAFYLGLPLVIYVISTVNEPTVTAQLIGISGYLLGVLYLAKINKGNKALTIVFYTYSTIQVLIGWLVVLGKSF